LGLTRVARGVGLVSAAGLGLLAVRERASPLAAKIAEKTWNAKLAATATWGVLAGDQTKAGVTQFYVFVIVLASVVGAALASASGQRLLMRLRVPHARWVRLGVDVAVFGALLVRAAQVSPFVGSVALTFAGGAGAAIALQCGVGRPYERAASERAIGAVVLVAEAVCFAWGLFQTHHDAWGSFAIVVALGLVAASAWRAGRGGVAMVHDAVAGVPLLALPWVQLVRGPSYRWPLGLLALGLCVRAALAWVPRGRRIDRVPRALAAWVAPTSVVAVLVLPLRFRELGEVSHMHHEGFHLGWLSSMTYGKLMFADAGLTYGPAREYLIALLALVFGGFTLEHVRLAHLVLNLTGAAVLLGVGWRMVRGNLWVFGLWAYLVVTRTPLMFFLNYPYQLCFGWADVARPAFGLLAVVGATSAAEREDSRAMLAWGGFAAFATLYSQDIGPVAVVATLLALAAQAFAQRRVPFVLRRALRVVAAYLAGVVGVLGAFVFVYVVSGRGPALRDALIYLREMASGVFGAAVYPLSATDFLARSTFLADLGEGTGNRFNYVAPPAILIVALVSLVATALYGRWSRRTTRFAGIVLLSAGMYRYALYRTDVWHLYMGAVPAYLVLVTMIADAWSHRLHLSMGNVRLRVPFAALAFSWLAWRGIQAVERHDPGMGDGVATRAIRIANGDEQPSAGDKYRYDLPRAGDVHVPQNTLDIATYIRAHTEPSDSIWVVNAFLDGGEIYFLSERRNPTRYDFWSEVTTHYECARAFEELKADPPVLIVGHGWRQYTDEITAWVNERYTLVDTVGGVEMRRRSDAPVAAR
jgi:hypothetical protein